MPRLTNAQKQENYRKRKKEAEEGSQTPKNIRKTTAEYKRESRASNTVNFFLSFFLSFFPSFFRPCLTQAAKTF
jgi:hypothetical protein